MKPRLRGTTAALALGITAAVAAACVAGAWLYSTRHYDRLLDMSRRHALARVELFRDALEHGMLEDDRSLIEAMIATFGRDPEVVNVMLLDREGVVQFSSGAVGAGSELNLQSPTCQACHQFPPAQRAASRVIETRGGEMLRTVVPFRNRAECHECHDPADEINGVLISDLDAREIRAAAGSDLRWMAGVAGAIALLLVAAIGLVLRLVILRRLQRFETAARQIAQGELDRRVPAEGDDTISWLAREFNVMADSVSGLGNVRELLHTLEAAMVVCDGPEVLPEHLPKHLQPTRASLAQNVSATELPTLDQLERAHIELTLRTAGGHRGRAARILGISERNLYRKLKEYGLGE